jgi:hypothetical protein
MNKGAMGRGLGWFSIALGVYELVAPRSLARCLGVEERTDLIRFYGLREITSGIGLLSQRTAEAQVPWLWSRVGGDALDLATLFAALGPDNPKRRNVEAAILAVAGVTLLDLATAKQYATSGSASLPEYFAEREPIPLPRPETTPITLPAPSPG